MLQMRTQHSAAIRDSVVVEGLRQVFPFISQNIGEAAFYPTAAVPPCFSALHVVIAAASSMVTSEVVIVSTVPAGVEICTVIGSFVFRRRTVVTSLV